MKTVLVAVSVLFGVLATHAEDEWSSFECSDERLNELHRACCRLAKENLARMDGEGSLRKLSGCGTDAIACMDAFANNADMRDFYVRLLREYLSEAAAPEWCVTVEPSEAWPVAVPTLLDVLYRYYGMRDILSESLPALEKCARFMLEKYPDWKIANGPVDRYKRDTRSDEFFPRLIWLCYLNSVGSVCERVGRADAAESWRMRAAEMRAVVRDRDLSKDGGTPRFRGFCSRGTQATGFAAGVFEPAEKDKALFALEWLVRHGSNDGLTTGELTTRLMLEEVSRHQFLDLAIKAVGQTAKLEEDFLVGSIDAWLLGYVLGVRVADDAIGGNRVTIRYPRADCAITWAKGTLRTAAGTVKMSWNVDARGNVFESHEASDGIELVGEMDAEYPREKFKPMMYVSFPTWIKPGGFVSSYIELRWDDPSVVPDVEICSLQEGHMEVERGASTFVRFYHDGQARPVREYEMIPGKTTFRVLYRFEGKLRSEKRFIYEPGDVLVEELRDPDGTLLARESLLKHEEGSSRHFRSVKGDVVEEWWNELYYDIGERTVFSSAGTGTNCVWTLNRFYHTGVGLGSLKSKLCSDGDWAMYEYAPNPSRGLFGRVVYTLESAVTTPIDRAKAVTNEEGVVVGFVGKAKRVEHTYEPVAPEDDGTFRSTRPRMTVVWELADDGTRREISREYFAALPADKPECKTIVREKATRPGAPYGDPGNERKTAYFNGDNEYDVIPHVEQERFEGEGGVWIARSEYEGTGDAPDGTPYETVVRRTIVNPRGYPMREEEWIMLPDGERELMTWKNYTRDADGNEIATEASSGDRTTKMWEDRHLVSARDADGLVRNYGYDAIGRRIHADGNVYDHNAAYDLGSYVTNVFGSVYGLRYDYGLTHDDAGRYTDMSGEPGEKFKQETGDDGVTRTWMNGLLLSSSVTREGVTTTYLGPKGLQSPRWRSLFFDPDGRFSVMTTPRIGGGVVTVTNRYDRADFEKHETRTRYEKIRGCWWRNDRTEVVSGTNRTFRCGNRVRVTGRRTDGADEYIEVDEKGYETRTLTLRDPAAQTTTEIVTVPTASLPEINITSNGVTVMSVSRSQVTNIYERGFQGRLVAQTDGRGGVTRLEYDRDGRLCAKTDPLGGRWLFAEDRHGRPVSMTCPSGLKVEYRYDDFGRETEVSAGETRVASEYDGYGDLVRIVKTVKGEIAGTVECRYDEPTGLLLSRVVDGRETVFEYDASNRVVKVGGVDVVRYRIALTNGLEIVHDDFGRAVSYSVNGVRKMRQAYDDKTGRLTSVAVDGLGEVKIAYLAGSDLVETLSYPDGRTARFFYDAADRPLRVVWNGGASGEETFEAPPAREWEPPETGACPSFDRPPIADDPRIYVLDGGLTWPIARKDAQGRLGWCRLNADFEEVE